MIEFFTNIYQFLAQVWNFLITVKNWIFEALTYFLSEFLYLLVYVFDLILSGFYTAVLGVISALDFSGFIASSALNFTGLPDALIYLIVQCGIPQGLTIISTALIMRLTLNLIPSVFTRV